MPSDSVFPELKPSNIDWLGDIPAHWPTAKIWMLFRLGRGRVISNLEIQDNAGEYPVYSSQTENNGVLGYIDSYEFDGDYLTWTTDGAKAGTVFCREGKFNCTNVCGTMLAKIPVVLKYYLHALNIATEGYIRYDINPKLMNDVMARILVPIPPLEEQQAIADYLDRKTAQIDAVVREKARQIELLGEHRQALISHAVTRGIHPAAPVKPSGIAWLGDVPAHWEIAPLKRQFRVVNGATPSSGTGEYWNGDIVWVTPEDLSRQVGAIISESDRMITQEGYAGCGTQLVPAGSIVLSTRAPIGHVRIAGVPLCTNQGCRGLSFIKPADAKFWYYLMLTANAELNSRGNGSTFRELSTTNLQSVPIPVPPLEEQREIAEHLDRETTRIDGIVQTVQSQIERLREYRQAVISAAVTGKIAPESAG